MRELRFGVNLRTTAAARRAEELGYDAVTFPDHLVWPGDSPVFADGAPAPFPALVAAASATSAVACGTLTLNAAFYNPSLLAREVRTVSTIVGDRFELGLGSGHMKSEFDDAGVPFESPAARLAHLDRVVQELRTRLDPGELPPLLIGGNSDRVLDLAAREADIVGFAGLTQVRGAPPGTFDLAGHDDLAERVSFFAGRAGPRVADVERNMLIQFVAVTDDAPAAVREWMGGVRPDVDPAEILGKPQLLVGSLEQIVAEVEAMRERFGFSYFTVMEPSMEAFAPVVAALRGR